MNATEAGQLLAILAALDNREIDATKAQGWAWALHDIPLDRAFLAARQAFNRGAYVDLATIRTELRAMQPRLEADVRSAKLRGLIPDTWPKTQPLTGELEQQLGQARAAEYQKTNDKPEAITSGNGTPANIGQVGRSINDHRSTS